MIDELYTARFCEEFERQDLRERRTVHRRQRMDMARSQARHEAGKAITTNSPIMTRLLRGPYTLSCMTNLSVHRPRFVSVTPAPGANMNATRTIVSGSENLFFRRAGKSLARCPIFQFLRKGGPIVLLFHEYPEARTKFTIHSRYFLVQISIATKIDQASRQHCSCRRDNHGRLFIAAMGPATGYEGISIRDMPCRIWNAQTHYDLLVHKPIRPKIVVTNTAKFMSNRLNNSRPRDVIRGCPDRGQNRGDREDKQQNFAFHVRQPRPLISSLTAWPRPRNIRRGRQTSRVDRIQHQPAFKLPA